MPEYHMDPGMLWGNLIEQKSDFKRQYPSFTDEYI